MSKSHYPVHTKMFCGAHAYKCCGNSGAQVASACVEGDQWAILILQEKLCRLAQLASMYCKVVVVYVIVTDLQAFSLVSTFRVGHLGVQKIKGQLKPWGSLVLRNLTEPVSLTWPITKD